MMKRLTLAIAAAVFFIAACTAPAPPATPPDTTPPEITVTVRARGRNVFKSIDGPLKGSEMCIIIEDGPVQLVLIAGDAGGLDAVSLSTFTGTIVPGSIDVTPRAPESTLSTPAGGLLITLPPPSPTTVRTGVVAIFEVEGRTPISVTAWARDRAGQTANLEQFDLRREFERIVCRNSDLK